MDEEKELQEIQPEESLKEKKPKKKAIWRRKYIHEVTLENDIKFRGPISYRHLRILGWLFVAIAQVGVILKFGQTLYHNPQLYGQAPSVLHFFGTLMTPLFLIAAFATVLNAKDGYKKLILMYSGLGVLFFIVFLIIYEHYFVGLFSLINPATAHDVVYTLFQSMSEDGFIAFNLFIDLLLCTLVTFFINYRPTRFFKGKAIYVFRSFALLPIAYEILSVITKVCASQGIWTIHPLLFPFLTTKPPLAFLVFVIMALFVKNRERFYIKKGKTHEDYKQFQKTNVNSLHFALFLVATIIVISVLDVASNVLLSGLLIAKNMPADGNEEMANIVIATCFRMVQSWGFGDCLSMLIIVPVLVFFDYKKTYKNNLIDVALPIAGIGLIVIIYLEVGYEVIRHYLADLIKSVTEDDPEAEPAAAIVHKIKDFISRK